MRIFGRRAMQSTIAAGTDQVIAEFPIPAGGRLNNINLEVHVLGPDERTADFMQIYGIAGFVVPILDPDAQVSLDTIWDQLIPKDLDAGSGVFDIDTGATDATPEYELGELDLSAVFELTSIGPREIFRRQKRLSMAVNPAGYAQIDSVPDKYKPNDYFTTKISKGVSVSAPSYVLIGFSSPDLTQTTATFPVTISEKEWIQYQYLEQAVENMLMFVAGLVEAGSETPYTEASDLVAKLLEADVFEEDAGFFDPVTFTVFCFATFDVTVPDRMQLGTLTGQ